MDKSKIKLGLKINLVIICGLFCTINACAQLNTGFIQHLIDNNLNRELEAYFLQQKEIKNPSDSLFYFTAKYELSNKKINAFHAEFTKAKSLILSDSITIINASCLFLQSNNSNAGDWFTANQFSFTTASIIQKAFLYSENPHLTNGDFLPASLQYTFNDFKKYNRKSPVIAGLLSAIIPGAGKLYNGRKHTFWPSFLLNTLQAARAGESIYRYGWKNPYSMVSVGLFSIFYFSNIYGNYHDLKQVKIEKKKNFLDEVADYYYLSGN